MKILMLSNDFLPNPGGVANHIFELSKAMTQLGHEVRVLHFCYTHIEPQKEIIEGVEIIRCWLTKESANKKNRFDKIARYLATMIKGSKAIRQQIKQFQPDVIHWHDYYHTSMAMYFVPFKGVKILTNHASGYLEQYAKGGLWHPYLKALAKPADKIIAPSQELADKSRLVKNSVFFIPNGVDTEKFKPLENKKKSREEFLLIAPRRLDPKNGLNFLISAMPLIRKEIPQIKLIIAGGGEKSLKDSYLQLAKELNVSDIVSITGDVPYKDMPSIMAGADLIIIPSLMEAVSLAALEAMASGVPVVASDVGGLPLIIDETVGALVPPKDPQALADAIINLYHLPPDELAKKGFAARERVLKTFTWAAVAKKTLVVYSLTN